MHFCCSHYISSCFLSISLSLSLSLSLFLSLSLSLSLYLCLSVVASHVSYDALYQAAQCMCMGCHMYPCILFLINLTFHNLSLHSSYTVHQPFTDYFLRLPYSELLEKRLFRSQANRRLVSGRPWHSICAIGSPSARLCHNIIAAPPGTVLRTNIYIYISISIYIYIYM